MDNNNQPKIEKKKFILVLTKYMFFFFLDSFILPWILREMYGEGNLNLISNFHFGVERERERALKKQFLVSLLSMALVT